MSAVSRAPAAAAPVVPAPRRVAGTVRLGRRTKVLVRRLAPGDVAVIDHRDLDRVSAEELAAIGVGAVLNCAPSTSGRYPNTGPLLLVQAGIHLVDLPSDAIFSRLREGDEVLVDGGRVHCRDELVAEGRVLAPEEVRAANDAAREEIGNALEAFARNTVEHMLEERELLAGKLELPRFATTFRDRPALVVVRGVDHRRDLHALRSYIRDVRPVIVAVDGGAQAVLEEGLTPDMIVGDMDSASEAALRCGAELVVHAYPDGRAPGRAALQRLDLPHRVVPAPGTSQDIAMLIAFERGASLIVSVGSQFNLVDFLDRNRRGMSSTFLTRLRIGERLIDAKGVSRLYRPRPTLLPIALVLVAGLITLAVIVWRTPSLRDVVELIWLKIQILLGIT